MILVVLPAQAGAVIGEPVAAIVDAHVIRPVVAALLVIAQEGIPAHVRAARPFVPCHAAFEQHSIGVRARPTPLILGCRRAIAAVRFNGGGAAIELARQLVADVLLWLEVERQFVLGSRLYASRMLCVLSVSSGSTGLNGRPSLPSIGVNRNESCEIVVQVRNAVPAAAAPNRGEEPQLVAHDRASEHRVQIVDAPNLVH